MKPKHFLFIILISILSISCESDLKESDFFKSNKELHRELCGASYKHGWIAGANSATYYSTNLLEFNDSIGRKLLTKDSLVFMEKFIK